MRVHWHTHGKVHKEDVLYVEFARKPSTHRQLLFTRVEHATRRVHAGFAGEYHTVGERVEGTRVGGVEQ